MIASIESFDYYYHYTLQSHAYVTSLGEGLWSLNQTYASKVYRHTKSWENVESTTHFTDGI